MYIYKIVKENYRTGKRANRSRQITRDRPLAVGALYTHLGKGYDGTYRILELIEESKD